MHFLTTIKWSKNFPRNHAVPGLFLKFAVQTRLNLSQNVETFLKLIKVEFLFLRFPSAIVKISNSGDQLGKSVVYKQGLRQEGQEVASPSIISWIKDFFST